MSACQTPAEPRSVHEDCIYEADRHKWIESERAGRDLGEQAIVNWVNKHWNGYLRHKWIEHLRGINFWIELDHDDFDLLTRKFQNSKLLDEILDQLVNRNAQGHFGENLSIIIWALEKKDPSDREEIMAILSSLNINSKRIECKLLSRLCPTCPE